MRPRQRSPRQAQIRVRHLRNAHHDRFARHRPFRRLDRVGRRPAREVHRRQIPVPGRQRHRRRIGQHHDQLVARPRIGAPVIVTRQAWQRQPPAQHQGEVARRPRNLKLRPRRTPAHHVAVVIEVRHRRRVRREISNPVREHDHPRRHARRARHIQPALHPEVLERRGQRNTPRGRGANRRQGRRQRHPVRAAQIGQPLHVIMRPRQRSPRQAQIRVRHLRNAHHDRFARHRPFRRLDRVGRRPAREVHRRQIPVPGRQRHRRRIGQHHDQLVARPRIGAPVIVTRQAWQRQPPAQHQGEIARRPRDLKLRPRRTPAHHVAVVVVGIARAGVGGEIGDAIGQGDRLNSRQLDHTIIPGRIKPTGLRSVIKEIELGAGGTSKGRPVVANDICERLPTDGGKLWRPLHLEQFIARCEPRQQEAVGASDVRVEDADDDIRR